MQSPALRAIAEGNAKFGVKLYESVRKEGPPISNIIMSPYSASSVMAMATVGARGNTLEEMRLGMQFPEEKEMEEGFSNAFRLLEGNENFSLETANKLFVQEGYELAQEFIRIMKEKFYAEATQVDFAASEIARKLINDWVEKKTKDKIKDLIAEGVLDSDKKLVLVNAIYFKAEWANKFDEEETWEDDFHVGEEKVVKTKFMHQNGSKFKMTQVEDLNSKIIELPYKGDQVSMYILLPNDMCGLHEVETNISKIKLANLFDTVDAVKVDLVLPKLKLESTMDLKDHLKKLGMVDMFDSRLADFSGMTGNRDLYVSEVLQKAFFEVNEEGTEAAAATYAAMIDKCAVEQVEQFEKFVCDHPFIFFIRDKATDMILFSGRVMDPTTH